MEMQEMVRLIEGLRFIGLSDTELVDFLLWVESGDKTILPKRDRKNEEEKQP